MIRRKQNGIGLHGYHLLNGGRHGVAAVGNRASLHATEHLCIGIIVGIAYALHRTESAEFTHQTCVHLAIHQRILDRRAHHRALWELLRHSRIARHKNVGVEHFAIVPRVLDRGFHISITLLHREQLRLLLFSRLHLFGLTASARSEHNHQQGTKKIPYLHH